MGIKITVWSSLAKLYIDKLMNGKHMLNIKMVLQASVINSMLFGDQDVSEPLFLYGRIT